MDLKLFIFTCFLIFQQVLSLKILVYNPRFGLSHVKFMGNLIDLLVEHGHDVVNFQPVNTEKFNETGTKLARTIIRERDYPLTLDQRFFAQQLWTTEMGGILRNYISTQRLSKTFSGYCKYQLNDESLMEKLKAEQFDFGITEYFDYCGLGLFEKIGLKKFGAVYISPLTQWAGSQFGVPSTTSFVPEISSPATTPFTRCERFNNFGTYLLSYYFVFPQMFQNYNNELRPILGSKFDIMDKFTQASLVFLNSDEFLEFSRPASLKFINIGGIGMSKPKQLNKKYIKLMEKAHQGIVLISFGTVARSCDMPKEIKHSFLNAFARFPQILFLWKYECLDEDFTANHSNVIIDKWWPQSDLLVHPKLLTFITHGGAGSISEAIHAGLPTIIIPLFADQTRNGKMVEYRKAGLSLSKFELTTPNIVQALEKILTDKSYKQNALKLSQLIKNKPMAAKQRFLEYVDFAAKYDINNELNMTGRSLNLIEFYNLDAIFVFFLAFCLISYFMYKFAGYLLKKLLSKFRKIKSE